MMQLLFKLALLLGKSLREVQAFDAKELVAWKKYFELYPAPDPWLQTGIQCATIANVHGGKMAPKDFIPQYEEQVDQVALNREKLRAMAARR